MIGTPYKVTFISMLVVCCNSIAGVHADAIGFAAEYSSNLYKNDIQWLKSVASPQLEKELEQRGRTLDWYFKSRSEAYFTARSPTILEEIGIPYILRSKNSVAAVVPWKRQIDHGIYVGQAEGAYILISENNSKWTVYDNDCSHEQFMAKHFPSLLASGNLAKGINFHPSGTIVKPISLK